MLLLEAFGDVIEFLERGGDVLLAVLGLMLVMWVLIIERFMYYRLAHPKLAKEIVGRWDARRERRSWEAHEIRQAMVAEADINLKDSLSMIKALVAVCPLLGLLGTVTGMIEVFDVMAYIGTGSARSMANGISKATIPTMAGMVGALIGVFAITLLERRARIMRIHLEDQLTFDH
ncbi:MAG: MotA/TolQ/ExbB proton channel family protein [Proteobacteria bacterium]|nr:MotA/TolQ/ExbB proton channel family protein [Pseudomonadota bacterium]